jgi:hypothetical protein
MRGKTFNGTTGGDVVSGPYRKWNRASNEVESEAALNTLINDMRKTTRAAYLPEKLKQGRENLEKALHSMGENDWAKRVDGLSSWQFNVLWFGNPAAVEAVFLKYEEMQKMARAEGETSKESWQNKVVEDSAYEFGEFLTWAERDVPREKPNANSNPANQTRKQNRPKRR